MRSWVVGAPSIRWARARAAGLPTACTPGASWSPYARSMTQPKPPAGRERPSSVRTQPLNAEPAARPVAPREIACRIGGERVRVHLRVGMELHAFDDSPHPGPRRSEENRSSNPRPSSPDPAPGSPPRPAPSRVPPSSAPGQIAGTLRPPASQDGNHILRRHAAEQRKPCSPRRSLSSPTSGRKHPAADGAGFREQSTTDIYGKG
jgi:hypothetical protein